MVSVSYQASTELRELIEDTVEYFADESAKNGEFISGETIWSLVECLAVAKQAQLSGVID